MDVVFAGKLHIVVVGGVSPSVLSLWNLGSSRSSLVVTASPPVFFSEESVLTGECVRGMLGSFVLLRLRKGEKKICLPDRNVKPNLCSSMSRKRVA